MARQIIFFLTTLRTFSDQKKGYLMIGQISETLNLLRVEPNINEREISHLVTGSASYQKIVIFCGHGQISDLPLSDRECFLPKNSNFLRAPLFSIPTKYCSSVTRELFRCTQVWTLTLLRARRAVCACSRWCRQDLIHGVVTVTALVWQARALTQCHSTLGITPPHVILV